MSNFPLGLTLGPPVGSRTPAGRDGLDEVRANGVTFVRTGTGDWSGELLDGQIQRERELHGHLRDRGLKSWLWLGNLPDLPGPPGANNEQHLTRIVDAFKDDPTLFAWKGYDEPRNPFRGANWIRPAGLVRAHDRIKALDPDHPVVIIQAPLGAEADLVPYRPAFDITGIDIYPVSYPPGTHAGGGNRDVNVVGDMARKIRAAAGGKPFWMTLQIAWSGVTPTPDHPDIVPRFPTLQQERFMAYEAIVNGARGLVFFGGHIKEVMTPDDAASGWNWTFWRRVLRPVVSELASPELEPFFDAANAPAQVKTADPQMELVTRRSGNHLYVIAVRTGGDVRRVPFTGLPRVTKAEVLFEYADGAPRPVAVHDGAFSDWFAAHDAHVYRFAVAPSD